MKKTYRLIGGLALCAALVPALVSCGDDDEPDVPDVPGVEGQYLTRVGDYNIGYDRQGRVEYVADKDDQLVIDYSKGTISSSDSDIDEMNIDFNGKGFISRIQGEWDEFDTEDGYKFRFHGEGVNRYHYNGDGNLVRIETEATEEVTLINTGIKYTNSERFVTDIEWQDGNLVSVTFSGTEHDEDGTEYEVKNYAVQYGRTLNPFYQMPLALSGITLDSDELEVLAATGLFGAGPEQLPASINYVYNGGSYPMPVSYQLDSYGAISSETFDNHRYDWSYTNVPSTRSSKAKGSKSARHIFIRK